MNNKDKKALRARTRRFVFWACLFLLFLFYSIPTQVLGAPDDSKRDVTSSIVRVRDNLLTVKVKDIPLKRLLTEIANQRPMKVTLHVPAEEPVSVEFSDFPLDKGLKRITRGFNTAFIYGMENGKERGSEITEVIVYAKEGTTPHRSTRPYTIAPKQPRREPSEDLSERPLQSRAKGLQDEAPLETPENPKDASMIPDLGKVLVGDQDDGVRAEAAAALGELGDEMALIPLVHALRDKNAQVRESAVDALCQIGGENVIRALKGCAADKDEGVRKVAAEALKRLETGQ